MNSGVNHRTVRRFSLHSSSVIVVIGHYYQVANVSVIFKEEIETPNTIARGTRPSEVQLITYMKMSKLMLLRDGT